METIEFTSKEHVTVKFIGDDTQALKKVIEYALIVSETTNNRTSFHISRLDPESEVVIHPVIRQKNGIFVSVNSHEHMQRLFVCQVKNLEQVSVFDDGRRSLS